MDPAQYHSLPNGPPLPEGVEQIEEWLIILTQMLQNLRSMRSKSQSFTGHWKTSVKLWPIVEASFELDPDPDRSGDFEFTIPALIAEEDWRSTFQLPSCNSSALDNQTPVSNTSILGN